MTQYLFSILSLFPFSFLVYAASERWIARHESRVGRQIETFDFFQQTWADTWLELKTLRPKWLWFVYFSQFSIVLIYWIDLNYLVYPYLAINGYLLARISPLKDGALERIDQDRKQVAFAVASVVAGLCLLGAFSLSGTANLSDFPWSFGQLFFVIPFQLAGMILFGEHPFQGFLEKKSWIESARFYAWTMLTVKAFMGGGSYFIDFNLKVAAVYLGSRILGIYFPRYRQKDLLRISILYLFPITGVIWFAVMLVYALASGGGPDV